ncbi:MAG: Rpn family recombination-promoting nuclease/putative transposase [Tepidibacter sp.]|jgi:predicted transposase/invertase (TIGR01784 family)|uniref:Rpn family recombination-promoting nuclease/putative transposase n=1 Tax=Tepidibacter sp. TaxID=2529387 RepID=UPI0025FE4A82|nr:Rpn family recombination-promoting nuclease/putative transposase [Tepidibacter sp.]MCT4508494.1 Rpn family recombination-promoting nuclease/putative transposase [Tepidibacter sp.]
MKGLLDPKIDFVFKNIFGSSKHPKILISFLNAILKPKNLITDVEIQNTDLEKHFVEDKFSRLDVKATTSNNEIINIEIQLKNEYNMIKRSLYYWSKLYEEQLGEGDNYSTLSRTICINILNFKYLKNDRFHNGYLLKEKETNEELTDIMEIHFIEIPKLKKDSDEKDMLVAWTEFLKNPESEKVRKLEMSIEEIKEAKDELVKLSNNDEQRMIYEIRSKILKDKVSALSKAKNDGIKQGLQQGIIETAKNLLKLGMEISFVKEVTKLSEKEIINLREILEKENN